MNKTTPIVAVTAHADSEERREMLNAGFNDHMGKPIMDEELVAVLGKWNQQADLRTRELVVRPPSIESNSNTEVPLVDLKSCLEVSGNRTDIAHDMLEKLLQQLPADRAAIGASLQDNDMKAYRQHVHKLHGHACYTGVPGLRSLCHDIESQLTSNNAAQAMQSGEKLDQEIGRLLDWYAEHDLAALFAD